MKTYKLKIVYPYSPHKKGDIIASDSLLIKMEDFPDVFEEIKEPIFVTADGVEIFEPEAIVWYACGNQPAWNHLSYLPKYSNLFSNIDACMKYIEETKPKFSEKQILDAIKKATISGTNPIVAVKSHILKELGL